MTDLTHFAFKISGLTQQQSDRIYLIMTIGIVLAIVFYFIGFVVFTAAIIVVLKLIGESYINQCREQNKLKGIII